MKRNQPVKKNIKLEIKKMQKNIILVLIFISQIYINKIILFIKNSHKINLEDDTIKSSVKKIYSNIFKKLTLFPSLIMHWVQSYRFNDKYYF